MMIKLEQFNESDFDRLISWIASEKLLIQFAGPIFSFPLTTNQLAQYISDKNRFAFTVISTETDEVIGHAEIYYSDNRTVKLCRILIGDKNLRGQGFGEEIVNQLVAYSFNKLGALEIELNVYDWNTSAIICYKKVGFKINPSSNQITKINGHEWNSINMIKKKQTGKEH